MFPKVTLFCVLLVIVYTEAFVAREKRDVTPSHPNPDILGSFQRNIEQFKNCIDQSLANTVEEINTKQLQPVFSTLGDSLNRVQKAFDDLTASPKTPTFQ